MAKTGLIYNSEFFFQISFILIQYVIFKNLTNINVQIPIMSSSL